MAGSRDLKKELEKLAAGVSRAKLQESWRRVYGSDPPEQISRRLLTQAVAYRLQVKSLGGLSFTARRALEQASEEVPSSGATSSYPQCVAIGGVLVRVWRGETHQVTIHEEGVRYRGECYGSLSEVARVITGTGWSGPRFFGVKVPKKNRAAR